MKAETRRVYIFIVVGLLAAAAVGYGVWHASTPSTPSASDIATHTPEVATISEETTLPQDTAPAEVEETTSEVAAQPATTPLADDPFLAPHAIVQPVPSTIAPTKVYRPENVRPTASGATPGEPTELITSEAPEAETPTSTTPANPSVTPEPSEPAEPTDPAGPTEPTDPAGPTEPTDPVDEPETPAQGTQPPAVPAQNTASPEPGERADGTADERETQQGAVAPQQPGWWIFGRWFPFSS